MAWVVDKGLDKLLAQINAAAPGRSKASDGSVGDLAHQGGVSDHNPEDDGPGGNPEDQVDARDITHDPAHNADMGVVAEAIRKSRDRRVSYVIFNRRIYSGAGGPSPWKWTDYHGDNPHDHHMHVSVRDDTHDQTQNWQIGIDDMALNAADAKTVWNTDGIINNRPFRPDYATNPTVYPETALVEVWDDAHAAAVTGSENKAAIMELNAKLDQILTAIAAGVVVPAQVTLTPESVAEVADATADELRADPERDGP